MYSRNNYSGKSNPEITVVKNEGGYNAEELTAIAEPLMQWAHNNLPHGQVIEINNTGGLGIRDETVPMPNGDTHKGLVKEFAKMVEELEQEMKEATRAGEFVVNNEHRMWVAKNASLLASLSDGKSLANIIAKADSIVKQLASSEPCICTKGDQCAFDIAQKLFFKAFPPQK